MIDLIIYDECAAMPEDVWNMLAAREHLTDGRLCWCKPSYKDGVVIHNNEIMSRALSRGSSTRPKPSPT